MIIITDNADQEHVPTKHCGGDDAPDKAWTDLSRREQCEWIDIDHIGGDYDDTEKIWGYYIWWYRLVKAMRVDDGDDGIKLLIYGENNESTTKLRRNIFT